MEMTESEIQRDYRLSKNKIEQIKILSELNQCTVGYIANLVKDIPVEDDNCVYYINKKEYFGVASYTKEIIKMMIEKNSYETKKSNDDELLKGFSERLTKCILDRGMKFSEFAKILNVSTCIMSIYTSGRNYPRIGTLIKMSELLGVTTDYLLKGE